MGAGHLIPAPRMSSAPPPMSGPMSREHEQLFKQALAVAERRSGGRKPAAVAEMPELKAGETLPRPTPPDYTYEKLTPEKVQEWGGACCGCIVSIFILNDMISY